jgi:phthalate 4,5-dioxygenase oxygenase subunit
MSDVYEALTTFGVGTPMGDLMREHWIPALPSVHLVADGAPRRVRLLGQDLVAFRDSNGAVGILDEACPHRGVSLALGRNEDCGLRCLFHGWKLDVTGRVVDTPNESVIEGYASRVPQVHHPAEEAGGIVWVYLGTRTPPSVRSDFAFSLLPADQVFLSMGKIHANWLPVTEAGFDQAHVRVLHQSALRDSFTSEVTMSQTMLASSRTRFAFDRRGYGGHWRFLEGEPGEEQEVRVGELVLPWWDLIGLTADPDQDKAILLTVPIDDRATMLWAIFYNTEHPLRPGQPGRVFAENVQSPETYRTDLPYDRDSNWGQNREVMDRHWTGIGVGRGGVGLFYEDIALMESIQPDWDRTNQHLGPSDALITRLRHRLLEALRDYDPGRVPESADCDVSELLPRFSESPVGTGRP